MLDKYIVLVMGGQVGTDGGWTVTCGGFIAWWGDVGQIQENGQKYVGGLMEVWVMR